MRKILLIFLILICSNANSSEIVKEVNAKSKIFIDGCEIANGYCEATNTNALEERFSEYKGPHSVVDTKDINGLPECAGVSIGVERLFAIKRRRQFI